MIGALLLAWAVIVAATSGVAIARRARRRPPTPAPLPCLLVRPCAGAEPGLADRLATLPPTASAPRVGFSVASADDAALPALREAAARLAAAGVAVEIRVIDPGDAPNRKAAQLVAWLADARDDEALVCADSDVDLADFPLDSLLAPLHDVGCGATWAPPAEHGGRTPGDHASAAFLGASLHSFTLLATLDPAGLVGKLFAVRARAMRVAGGFAGLGDCLGEDMEIARRLRVAGYHTTPCFAPVRALPVDRTLSAVTARFGRWLAVIRAQRPALLLSYPLLFGATTLLVPLGALAGGVAGWSAAGLALGARVAVAVAGRRFNRVAGGLATLPRDVFAGEWVTWAALGRALASRDVEWRGRRLRIGPGGRLQVVQERS
ncbi:MAG: glycosyltransferase [Myxococcales bacterium]|nr:glycosyltransferase [Myxococcales bacterium]